MRRRRSTDGATVSPRNPQQQYTYGRCISVEWAARFVPITGDNHRVKFQKRGDITHTVVDNLDIVDRATSAETAMAVRDVIRQL